MRLFFVTIAFLLLAIQCSTGQFWPGPPVPCQGPYEQFQQCASTCPTSCDDLRWRRRPKVCNLMCRNGCDCIQPYVRLTQSPISPCVHPRQCRFF